MTSWIGIAVKRRPLFYLCYTVSKVRTKSSLSAWKQQLDPGCSCESNKKRQMYLLKSLYETLFAKMKMCQATSKFRAKKYYSTSDLSFMYSAEVQEGCSSDNRLTNIAELCNTDSNS